MMLIHIWVIMIADGGSSTNHCITIKCNELTLREKLHMLLILICMQQFFFCKIGKYDAL